MMAIPPGGITNRPCHRAPRTRTDTKEETEDVHYHRF